jgi:hypothetical protein
VEGSARAAGELTISMTGWLRVVQRESTHCTDTHLPQDWPPSHWAALMATKWCRAHEARKR